jgi:GNAT superfamily N-acetyltransferase
MIQNNEISIRQAIKADIEDLVTVVNLAYRGGKELGGWTDESHLLGGTRIENRGIIEILENANERLLVAEIKTNKGSDEPSGLKKIVGCVRIQLEKEKEYSYIGMLTVDPRVQKMGVGKKLLKAAENLSKQEFGYKKSRMSVFDSRETLIHWYKKQGYTDVGDLSLFLPSDPMYGIPKVDKLLFVTLEKILS